MIFGLACRPGQAGKKWPVGSTGANSNITTVSDVLAEVGALESSFGGVALSEQTANGASIDGRSDVLDTAFRNADTNRDGTLDRAESESFLQRDLSN